MLSQQTTKSNKKGYMLSKCSGDVGLNQETKYSKIDESSFPSLSPSPSPHHTQATTIIPNTFSIQTI